MPDKKTAKNGPGRDSGGRFVPGCTGGPGRPKGSANAILTRARAWVEEGLDGLPIPTTEQDLPEVIGFALERVASGVLSIGDAAALVDLCRARIGAVNVARAPRLPDELFELN